MGCSSFVVKYGVPASDIVAYAKVEKELEANPTQDDLNADQIEVAKEYIGYRLSEFTQFDEVAKNVLFHKE